MITNATMMILALPASSLVVGNPCK